MTNPTSAFSPWINRFLSGGIILSLALPSAANALSVTSLLNARDAQVVTRADFLRGIIIASGMPLPKTGTVPYDHVPDALLPYVRAAGERKILAVFSAEGRALDFTKTITRGQAVEVLSNLLQLVSSGSSDNATKVFTDASTRADRARVSLALERQWLKPVSATFFGLGRPLRGKEAQLLLTRAFQLPAQTPGTETHSVPVIRIQLSPSSSNEPAPKSDLLDLVWKTLRQGFLYQDRMNPDKAADSAIQGLVNSLDDPYTVYMPKAKNEDFKLQMKGEVEGIGATVEMTGGILTIVSPLRGSPAEKAGLLPKDQILSVDGASIRGITLEDAVAKVRGPKDSTGVFRIRREGVEFDVKITRAKVFIPEVEVTEDQNVVIVKILQFWDTTDTKFRDTLAAIQFKNPRGIILDLRNNPGGLLHAAGVVASTFLPKNSTYVTIMERDDTHTEATTEDPVVSATVPMVVLVNKGSASASEIVAGALQDTKRAKIVGTVTYGKGTVQQVVQFSDGSSLKYTVAEWRTPLGHKINKLGVTPDVVIENDKDKPKVDLQMQKAMDLLR